MCCLFFFNIYIFIFTVLDRKQGLYPTVCVNIRVYTLHLSFLLLLTFVTDILERKCWHFEDDYILSYTWCLLFKWNSL